MRFSSAEQRLPDEAHAHNNVRSVGPGRLPAQRCHAFAYRRYLSGCDAKADLDAEDRASRPWEFRRGLSAAVITDGHHREACESLRH
jgi:hypothetical protein